MALEILVGRHPQELLSLLNSKEFDLNLLDVLDKRITLPTGSIVQLLVLTASLALRCIDVDPMSRPTMHQVSNELLSYTSWSLSCPLHTITLQDLQNIRQQNSLLVAFRWKRLQTHSFAQSTTLQPKWQGWMPLMSGSCSIKNEEFYCTLTVSLSR